MISDTNLLRKVITFGSPAKYHEILNKKAGGSLGGGDFGSGAGSGGKDFISSVYICICKLKHARAGDLRERKSRRRGGRDSYVTWIALVSAAVPLRKVASIDWIAAVLSALSMGRTKPGALYPVFKSSIWLLACCVISFKSNHHQLLQQPQVRQARINKESGSDGPIAEFEVVCKLRVVTNKVQKESTLKWSVWHRYSDFAALNAQLTKELG